jgi:hypothetical protein
LLRIRLRLVVGHAILCRTPVPLNLVGLGKTIRRPAMAKEAAEPAKRADESCPFGAKIHPLDPRHPAIEPRCNHVPVAELT